MSKLRYTFRNGDNIVIDDFDITNSELINIFIKLEGSSENIICYCSNDTYHKIMTENIGRILFVKLYNDSFLIPNLKKDSLVPVFATNGICTLLEYEVC